jgi:hypothetical protein
MAVRLSPLRADRPLPTGRFLVLISARGRVDPRAIVRLEGLGKLKKSNDIMGTRTCDLLACSIVPQPTRYRDDTVRARENHVNRQCMTAGSLGQNPNPGLTEYGVLTIS